MALILSNLVAVKWRYDIFAEKGRIVFAHFCYFCVQARLTLT